MKQKANHARSKQKRAKLRLKNIWVKVFTKRWIKQKPKEIKGIPFVGNAKTNAKNIRELSPDNYRRYLDHGFQMKLNQRQKRKLNRQTNNFK